MLSFSLCSGSRIKSYLQVHAYKLNKHMKQAVLECVLVTDYCDSVQGFK